MSGSAAMPLRLWKAISRSKGLGTAAAAPLRLAQLNGIESWVPLCTTRISYSIATRPTLNSPRRRSRPVAPILGDTTDTVFGENRDKLQKL
jgi:hypothetical protein